MEPKVVYDKGGGLGMLKIYNIVYFLLIIIITLTGCRSSNEVMTSHPKSSRVSITKSTVDETTKTQTQSTEANDEAVKSTYNNTKISNNQTNGVKTKDDIKIGETNGNLCLGGEAAYDGTYEYYWFGTPDETVGYLVKSKPDFTEKTILSKDRPSFINIKNDWIYYIKVSNLNGMVGQICKIKKDGSGRQLLFSGESSSMIIVGETIYFINCQDGYRVYSMNTSGEKITKYNIVNCDGLQYMNGFFFYSLSQDNDNLSTNVYKTRYLGKESVTKVVEIDGYFIAYANKIFFKDKNILYSCDINGKNKTKLFNIKINNFNISNNEIYCFVPDKNREETYGNQIYRISLDGKKVERITNDENKNIRISISCIVGDYIYYMADYGESVYELRKIKKDGSMDIELPSLNY